MEEIQGEDFQDNQTEIKRTNWGLILLLFGVGFFLIILVTIILTIFYLRQPINITQEELLYGKSMEIKEGQKIIFQLDGKAKHSLIVDSITSESVTITIKSEKITLTLGIGEERKIDLNKDGTYDLYIKLEKIEKNRPLFILKKIDLIVNDIIEEGNDYSVEIDETQKDIDNQSTVFNQTIQEKTCIQKNGNICDLDEKCSGEIVNASDTNKCCLGTCQKKNEFSGDCEDCPTPEIKVNYNTKIEGNIRYGYITENIVGVGGRKGDMLGFFYKNGTYKKGVSFPNRRFTSIKGKNNIFSIGDTAIIGFEIYDTDGNLKLTEIPEDQSGTSAIFVTDNLIGFGTEETCEKGNFYLYGIENNKINHKKTSQFDGGIRSIFINNDLIGVGFSELAWGCGSKGIVILDLEGNFLWNKTTQKTVNVVRIFNNKIVVGGGIGLKAYNKQGDLLWEKEDIYVDSLDANENIIAVSAGEEKLNIYDYSGNLLFNKEFPGSSMVIGDFAQAVCVNSKIIVSGGNKGLKIYDYYGNLILDYKTENEAPVYSVHCSEDLVGAGFGEEGYHLFEIENLVNS